MPGFNYFHDSMGRLNGMKNKTNSSFPNIWEWVKDVEYGPAGEMKQMKHRLSTGNYYTETRQYNALLQLTRMTATGPSVPSVDLEYLFPGQNNGRISGMKDHVTGEEVEYTYDALNRLTRAETIGRDGGCL